MTIGTIFSRYTIPEEVRSRALARGAYVLALQRAWVGPNVAWPLLVKTVIFADLGEAGAHVRKKIGLDKYAVTLISRGVPKYMQMIAEGHDWHQKLYCYAAYKTGVLGIDESTRAGFECVTKDVEHNLLHEIPMPDTATAEEARALCGINILHYKNPSV